MSSAGNRLCALMRCQMPLISAPMLGSGEVGLARAVAITGAVGSVPCSGMAAAKLHAMVRENAEYCLCYNFFCHTPSRPTAAVLSSAWLGALQGYFSEEGIEAPADVVQRRLSSLRPTQLTEEQVEALLEAAAARTSGAPLLLSFHFGLPPDALYQRLLSGLGRGGVCIAGSATTVEEAVYLRDREVDVVVCQGAEAGGHRGLFLPASRVEEQLGTFALVPQVRARLGGDACLVAAGGIADAATARAARMLGADGVQVGTAFLRTREAATSLVHRRALGEARAGRRPGSSITNLFSGRPARGLRNRLMAELGPMRAKDGPSYPTGAAYLADLRQRAEADGRDDYSSLWAGQNLDGCVASSAAERVAAVAAGLDVA